MGIQCATDEIISLPPFPKTGEAKKEEGKTPHFWKQKNKDGRHSITLVFMMEKKTEMIRLKFGKKKQRIFKI